jgi:hypothetical protein
MGDSESADQPGAVVDDDGPAGAVDGAAHGREQIGQPALRQKSVVAVRRKLIEPLVP